MIAKLDKWLIAAGALAIGCGGADSAPDTTPATPASATAETAPAELGPPQSKYVEVLGSKMHYLEQGTGDPVLFLHGNPTSSFLWRNIMPHVATDARAIAVDLIGMGKSDKPDIDYRFVDHARYLDEFIATLGLENITLVIHDWGSGLGFHYAHRHEDKIKGIAFMEALFQPYTYELMPAEARPMIKQIRTPGVGEKMVMEQNVFLKMFLPNAVAKGLSEEALQAYLEPFPTPASRKPIWRWVNEIPVSGEPKDVHDIVVAYHAWLKETPLPKLVIHVEPGMMIRAQEVAWLEKNVKNLATVNVGPGLHFIQEDAPDEIGKAIANWYRTLE